MYKQVISFFLLLIPLLSACTLSSSNLTPEPLATATPEVSGKPNVIIGSPNNGDEIALGDDILVSAIATDNRGVTSVQLFAGNTLVKTISSQSPAGDRNLPVVLDYTPRSDGELTLEVIAYRGTVASDPATVTVQVLAEEQEISVPVNPDTGPVIDPNDPTCRILTNVALNYRTGPDTNFDRLGTFTAGQQVPIVGRLGDNSWWQVQVSAFQRAWVSSAFTTEYGNCINIPIVTPPPTPTTTAATSTPTSTQTATPTPTPTPSITPTPIPADLVVPNITGADELTLSGGTATARYSVTITNTGGRATGPFIAIIRYLPGGDELELGAVSNLNPGESISLSTNLTFEAAGEFTVQVTADSESTVDEISEVNNLGTYVVIVANES